MKTSTLSRRRMLRHTAQLVVVGSAPVLLNACKKAEFRCDDVTDLPEDDTVLRTQLEYVDRSPHGEEKNCQNCAFFKAGKKDECGKCTLVKGPIHPSGYCNSWAAKG